MPTASNRSRVRLTALALGGLLWIGGTVSGWADAVTRSEALKIAETYVFHSWPATPKNVRHGKDAAGIEIHTPDTVGQHGDPQEDCWRVNATNTGVPYKWGGFDTLASFDAGIRAGEAAGDVYTADKRRLGGAAVSGDAVGVDCSGFVSRCWKLRKRQSTSTFPTICQKLSSAAALQPADAMNTEGGHVLLFVKWLDAGKQRALFYEAAPFSKTRATERVVADLTAAGCTPLRYRQIQD